MTFSPRFRIALVLAPTVLSFAALSAAQTLEHRPAPKPNEPTEAHSPVLPVLPKGTSLQVETSRHYPMKAGEAIEARLLHPIFCHGELAVPANTPLRGHVVSLGPDTKTRWHGRLRGDFTPFHTVQVQFDEMMLPSGPLGISTTVADNGAPVLRLSAPGASPKQSLLSRQWTRAKSNLHDRVEYITAPGKADRALQLLYHQLPYHPERIDAQTAWSFELTAPSTCQICPLPQQTQRPRQPVSGKSEIWAVHATLSRDLTSATAKQGDPVEALVVEPVFDRDRNLVVPQGSKLIGRVSAAKAAKSLGRNGKLRFNFQQVQFPEGFNQPVQGSLAGAATEKTQNLSLDAEGTITPRNKASAIGPMLLTLLAGRALDEDGNLTLQTGVASNSFGLIGRIVGMAAGNRNFAAGLGYYAAGLSFYDNFLQPGRDVVFPHDTRIEIETTPLRAPVLTPGAQ